MPVQGCTLPLPFIVQTSSVKYATPWALYTYVYMPINKIYADAGTLAVSFSRYAGFVRIHKIALVPVHRLLMVHIT